MKNKFPAELFIYYCLIKKFKKMLEKNQLSEGFQLLEENQLLQEFHVEELEKRYEFAWGTLTASYSQTGGVSVSYSVTF